MDWCPNKKMAGVLAPVFALRGAGDLGIGDVAALREAVRWAAENRLRFFQILPVNEPGSDHSPYNLLSAMALDPLTISTRPEEVPGLASSDFEKLCAEHDVGGTDLSRVHYPHVQTLKRGLLEAAYTRFSRAGRSAAFESFQRRERGWLEDYALFRALVDWHGSEVNTAWPAEHRAPEAARQWLANLKTAEQRSFSRRMRFWKFVQWTAWAQWERLKTEAEALGVALAGDVPVGVSLFSADVWAEPEIFDLSRWSGAPPERVFQTDVFTARWGQNWGFPLYNWERMSRDNFRWWRRRLRALFRLFHFLRVDHALGFFRIYSFPWRPEENEKFKDLSPAEAAALTGGELPRFVERGDDTPEDREYNRQRGEMIFRIFLEEAPAHRLIAEDLGEVAPYVRPTLASLEIPGFKIPQWEREGAQLTPGEQYPRLSLATFATHDHPPIRTFWEELFAACADPQKSEWARAEQRALLDFCGRPDLAIPCPYSREVHQAFLAGLLATNSWLAVAMITDLFGSTERFNVPGSAASDNWSCRIAEPVARWNEVHAELLQWFRKTVKSCERGD